MSENWWGLAWVACGLPFALVCTAEYRREEKTWVGLLPGISIGLLFGPFSLLMIGRERDDEGAAAGRAPRSKSTNEEEPSR